MTTAFDTLTLEVYYRSMPLFQTDSLLPATPKPKDKENAEPISE
jgi:hypothetical protein